MDFIHYLPGSYSKQENYYYTVMDKLDNIQQLKEWTADKILVLDISKGIKLLSEIEQSLEDTIIWKFQAENNIHLKYTPMEEPTECN